MPVLRKAPNVGCNLKDPYKMKLLLFLIGLTFTSMKVFAQQADAKTDTSFTLSYISIGLGSNMWTMQPMFRVQGSQFIYTAEEAWQFKDSEKPKADTLLIGNYRASSIDSILNISTEIKGDSVYKLNPRIMSGGIINLYFSTNRRKLSFDLHNSNDTTAQKIVDILNGYIPDKYRKLWISDIKPEIIDIK